MCVGKTIMVGFQEKLIYRLELVQHDVDTGYYIYMYNIIVSSPRPLSSYDTFITRI